MRTDRMSIFDYSYLREFEAKIAKAVTGTSAEPIYQKNGKSGLIAMSL
jgi:hypothetical protein